MGARVKPRERGRFREHGDFNPLGDTSGTRIRKNSEAFTGTLLIFRCFSDCG
jgi:hypothetical protein